MVQGVNNILYPDLTHSRRCVHFVIINQDEHLGLCIFSSILNISKNVQFQLFRGWGEVCN